MAGMKKRIRFVDPDRMSDDVVVEWAGNDAKRPRIDADEAKDGGAAAAAAVPPSGAASAAAAIRRDAAAAAAAAAIPLPDEPDAPECPVCTHARMKCPTCRDDQPMKVPAGMAEAAVSTPAAWLRCIPQSADIIQSIRRSQHLKLALQHREEQMRALPSMRCSEFACASPALHWCAECDLELCTAHDASTHARHLSSHKRELTADRQARKRARLDQVHAAAGAQLKRDVRSTTDTLKKALETKKNKRQVLARELAQIDAAIAGQEAQLAELSAAAALLAPLSDMDAQKHEATVGVALSAAAVAAAAAPASAPVVPAVAAPPALPPPGLLGSLTAARLADLLGYLRTAGASLHRRTLLYRASHDGFRQQDFMRMCAGRSGTLTLVSPTRDLAAGECRQEIKVKGNGYVFGAYTHCSWPAVKGTVADPTGKSFLFSLVNGSGQAVRFSLRDKDRAIQLADRICFGAVKIEDGKATGHTNFMLMFNGHAADGDNSHTSNDFNANQAYQPDDASLNCDETFLAGSRSFAAAEIEVYQL